MINMSKRLKITLISVSAVVVLVGAMFGIYLKVLPAAVSNKHVINLVEKTLYDIAGLQLNIKNPVLKTELSPVISFKVDELSLFNKKEQLLAVENFDTTVSFQEIFSKNIIIRKLGADYIFADINNLTKLAFPQSEKKEQQKSEWNIDLFDSLLYVKKSLFLYKVEPKTYISLKADDLELDNNQKDVKYYYENDNQILMTEALVSSKYVVSIIKAFNLFLLYYNNIGIRKEILEYIQKVIDYNICLEDFLNKYELSFDKCIEETDIASLLKIL